MTTPESPRQVRSDEDERYREIDRTLDDLREDASTASDVAEQETDQDSKKPDDPASGP